MDAGIAQSVEVAFYHCFSIDNNVNISSPCSKLYIQNSPNLSHFKKPSYRVPSGSFFVRAKV